jgi:hypothetical protein
MPALSRALRFILYSNTKGVDNTASGAAALDANTTGGGNTVSGSDARYGNTQSLRSAAPGGSAGVKS